MGISCMKSCSSSPYATSNSNPDPKKFTIVSEEYFGDTWYLLSSTQDVRTLKATKSLSIVDGEQVPNY